MSIVQAYLSRSKSQYYSTKTFSILRFCHRQVLQYKLILTCKAGTQMRTQKLKADYSRWDSISMEHKINKITVFWDVTASNLLAAVQCIQFNAATKCVVLNIYIYIYITHVYLPYFGTSVPSSGSIICHV